MYFKHFYYMIKYIVRLTEFIKTFIVIGVFIGLIILIALYIIMLYNTYLAVQYNLPTVKIDFSRFSPLFILGWIAGSLLSVFLKPKLERFADRVNAKPKMIYIFGSNDLTRNLVRNLISLGFGPMTALIAEKSYYWIEALGPQVDLLILDVPEELKVETLYQKVTFKNAIKIVILIDDPELSQHVLVNVRKVNPDAPIIVLSQYKPPIIDLVGEHVQGIQIINDIETIVGEIIRRLALGFDYAPVIEAYAPEEYIGKSFEDLEYDFNYKVKVLGVKRGDQILQQTRIEKNDRIILYLLDRKILREFLALIPKVEVKVELKEVQKTEPSPGNEKILTNQVSKTVEETREETDTSSIFEKLKKQAKD